MTLVARIAALSLLTSVLVAALGLAVLSVFVDPSVPSGGYVLPGLVLACVGGIIGAIAGTAREIVAARGATQPQATGLSTATKRRTPRVTAAIVLCFLCFVVVWFKPRSSANDEPGASKAPVPPKNPQLTVKPATPSDFTKSSDADNSMASASDADSKIPEAIQALLPLIVTVTRVEPVDPSVEESARPKPLSHVGVFFDSRGYIVIPMLPCSTQPKLFVVRFANQQETMGELAAVDESLKVGVLKIARPLPVKAVSIDKSREARRDDRVLLVPSSASNELRSGRVLTTTFDLGEEGSTKLIQADIACPLSEFGSLMVSEAGEPIGLVLASRTIPKRMSIALPFKAIQPVLQAAIDKPKDVPLVKVAESSPAIDLHKPVPITLQPATPLAKSLVEHFAPRGAKVLEYEEGKRLKIEAPPLVLEELTKQLSQVLREQQKPEATTAQPTDTPADAKMPDISGTWRFPNDGQVTRDVELSRVQSDSVDFEYVNKVETLRVKWSAEARQFEGTVVNKFWEHDYLQPGDPFQAAVRLEVRLRRDVTDAADTHCVSGTCVSPDGLIVIPIASQTLMADEPFVAFGIKGTASIVAADDKHGLTLLKLSSPATPLFPWVKCRSGKPAANQQLRRFCHPTNSYASEGNPMAVGEVGQPYPKPFSGNDAFAALTGETLVFEPGDRLMSVENELQGLILTSTPTPTDIASKKEENRRALAIPAVHIQKLIDEYRDKSLNQKPDGKSLSQPPKDDVGLALPPDNEEANAGDARSAGPVVNAEEFTLNKGDHICIVGNTLAERMQHFGWLETLIHARFPEHNLVFRNLGYSGDEIDGWQNPNHRLRSMSFGSHDEWLSGVAPCPQPAKLSKKDLWADQFHVSARPRMTW